MSNNRLIVAEGFGVLALVLALINDLAIVDLLGISPQITGILALIFALVAFLLAVEKGSVLISGLLVVQGTANAYSALSAGVAIGIYFGLFVLALGLTKAVITTARLMSAKKEVVTQRER